MSRNGSGTYNLPAGNPVVSGTTISSTWANSTLSDIASALTGSIASDGQTPMSGTLNMTDNLIINVAAPITGTDASNKTYVDTTVASAVAIIDADIAAINQVLTGSIQMWSTGTAPTGYLLCGGAAVSRTTYAALFAVIGTTFGSGDGSTTFNLPNYTNRFPYGATLASTGGTADAVVVSHTHTITDPGHSHVVTYRPDLAGGTGGYNLAGNTNTVNTNSATTGISVDTAGVSGTNANIPPYLGINFIIKT